MSRQYTRHIIISLPKVDSREKAQAYVGKKVVFKTTSGKQITGEISAPHGNKGCVRALFERALPGQCLGTVIEVQ
ncbi:MAG TPA: 50S ribosomal protein L35ae [Candidatus Nanoarchaeia archaeon]|nr:50S ribosomal protein L35ae [Candidatus Nanoarchaeia archaeon]